MLIDSVFLRTVPKQHLRYGAAEILKIAIVRDAELFELFERDGLELILSGFATPPWESKEVIWRSAERMLEELETNPYENRTYKRLVDFGHTFSPRLESVTNFRMTHGEAVAVDIALSAVLAETLGQLDSASCARILAALGRVDLPIWVPELTVDLCLDSLTDAANHRGGRPNLVLPTAIGDATFVESREQIFRSELEAALERLHHEQSLCRSEIL